MRGALTLSIQARIIAVRFSDLWIVKESHQISSDSVEEAVVQWFRKQPKEFFADGLH
jgi:hypothetical protein